MNRASQYKYPELWAGCVGAWCPSVDQRKGTTLLSDQSGRQNNGRLTNMTPDDWVMREGGAALNFDSSTNVVNLGSGLLKSKVGSLSLWFNSSNVNSFQGLIGTRVSDSDEFTVLIGPTNTLYVGSWAGAIAALISQNVTYHVVLVGDGQKWTGYLNGVPFTGVGNAVNFSTFTGAWEIGISRVNRFQSGWIDDVRLYNRVISQSEIKLLRTRRGIAYETNATKVTRFGSDAGGGAISGATSLTFTPSATALGGGVIEAASTVTFTTAGDLTGGAISGATSLTFALSGALAGASIVAGATTLTFTATGTAAQPQPTGGGGPGNAQRGRKRAVYMVDGKVFDRAEDAARYLASVTLPEVDEAQPAPRPRRAVPVAEVEIEGERLALEPIALPVSATPEFVADMVRGELQAARRKLQRRQEALEREEMAAVLAAMQLLLDDGEEIVFH
jgi:hypothetical protein